MSREPDPRSTPGPAPPDFRWEEYEKLQEAVDEYVEHDAPDPRYDRIIKGLAPILGEYLHDQFVDAMKLSGSADKSCVRRLITGEDECTCHGNTSWQDREREVIGVRDQPPHSPPHSDHATLWLDEDGEPSVYGMHVYSGNVEGMKPSEVADPDQQRRNGWMDMTRWAREWGLEISFLPTSWYNLGSATHVIFYPPERRRSD